MKYVLFILLIFISKGKITLDNMKIENKDLDENNINKICDFNLINSNYLQDSTNDSLIELKLGKNNLNSTKDSIYFLNLNEIEIKNKEDLIIYTNLTKELYIVKENDEIENINFTFHILKYNDYIENKTNITFKLNESQQGFIDLSLSQGEFQINKNIIREQFYKRDIKLKKGENHKLYYINYIPSDNDSDCYYLQYDFDPDSSSEKKKIYLYYLNKLNEESWDKIFREFKDNEVTRDRNIKGKIELFGIEYKDLKKNITLELKYNRIKGEGNTGFIMTLSILFFILTIIVGIFLRNAYCGNLKRFSNDESVNEQ